jgi:class 3 adenylate cyclase
MQECSNKDEVQSQDGGRIDSMRGSSVEYANEIPLEEAGKDLRARLGSTKAVAIMPRRISRIDRTDSSELVMMENIFRSSNPPNELPAEVELGIEETFAFVPKLVHGYCEMGDHHEVEILLYRRTRKFIEYLRKAGSELEKMPTKDLNVGGVRTYFRILFSKTSQSKQRPVNAESNMESLIESALFTDWLAEFLFMVWYSSIPVELEDEGASISSIRQACKQIVWRVVHMRAVKNRTQWNSTLLKLCPWRLRLRLGDTGPFGEKTWNEVIYEPFERDKLKIFSSSERLHWLTREFSDPGLEKTFQVDRARRLMRSCYWPFFLTVVLALGYVVVQYGLLRPDYPSITLVRLFMTEPVSLLIIAAIIQLVGHTVLFADNREYRENFFLYQFLFALVVCFATAAYMYQVRQIFLYVVWRINEGFTMAFVMICITCLFYVRFIYVVWLTILTAVWTVVLRAVTPGDSVSSLFTIQQGIAVIGAIFVVWGGRYLFETHTRTDFILTQNLFAEAQKSDQLLQNLLPKKVIQHLKYVSGDKQASGIAEAYDNVTILFADVSGFTAFSCHITPEQLVQFLNELFTCFDDIAEDCGLEKIKTIGDAYMAVAGLDHPSAPAVGAAAAARMGLMIVDLMKSGRFRDHEGKPLQARVGIHTGPCVAGVIGRKKLVYDIWSDAVNCASRMESTGETNRVHCSEDSARLLTDNGDFWLEKRGEIEVKGKGLMTTYFVTQVDNNLD